MMIEKITLHFSVICTHGESNLLRMMFQEKLQLTETIICWSLSSAYNEKQKLSEFVLAFVDFDLELILLWNDWINTGVSNVKEMTGKLV